MDVKSLNVLFYVTLSQWGHGYEEEMNKEGSGVNYEWKIKWEEFKEMYMRTLEIKLVECY